MQGQVQGITLFIESIPSTKPADFCSNRLMCLGTRSELVVEMLGLICAKNRRGIKVSSDYANTSLQPTAAPQERFSPRSSFSASLISAGRNEEPVFESVSEEAMRRKLHTMLI
jgi:hypothetical protein